MGTKDWIFLFGAIVGPVVAVWISVWLMDRKEKRKEKMEFFKELMISRAIPGTLAYVKAVNCIDVVFADSKKVKDAWRALHEEYGNDKATVQSAKNKKIKLIEEIAKELGYKGITWDKIIENSYTPKWLSDEWENNDKLKERDELITKFFYNANQNFPTQQKSDEQKPVEKKD